MWWAYAAGALVGFTKSIFNNYEQLDNLDDAEEYINKMYDLKKKEAELEYNKAKDEANKNAEQANKRADISDLGQDLTEKAVSQDFNLTIDNLYLGQQQNVLDWNKQAMNAGKSEGASLAGLAGSGIRAGSSLSEAVEMEAAVNSQQLQFSQDATRKTEDLQLGKLLTNLAGNKFNIYGNRVEADTSRQNALDLVNSYAEGGANWNLYQNQLNTLQAQYNENKRKIDEERKKYDGWNAVWNNLTAAFSMGSTVAGAANTLTEIGTKAAAYNKIGNLNNASTKKTFSGFRSI